MTTPESELPTLKMLRATVDLPKFQEWSKSKQLQDPDHAMHSLLGEIFGQLAPRPFRLLTRHNQPQAVLYGYTRADAAALRDSVQAFADPVQVQAVPPDRIETKPIVSTWTEGQRLGFELRARPVVRRSRGTERPGAETDAFNFHVQASRGPDRCLTREQTYTQWLDAAVAFGGAATLEPGSTSLVSYHRQLSIRKVLGNPIEGPDALFRGNLVVTDPDAFDHLLARGVGRHRAYGYGMLLLRPPGPPV